MTTRFLTRLLAVATALGVTACAGTYGAGQRSQTSVEASGSYGSFDDYDALAPYGTWVAVSYGWAWCPLDVPAGWRPYTVGRWEFTDYGWMWLSDDPWGALPYHYGRWGYDDSYGWVWVPGDVWAPAWVAWRYGDDYVGWAPLPPDLGWQVGAGFRYSVSSVESHIDPLSWCFVGTSGFQSARVADRLAPPSRNPTLLSMTRNVTRYDEVRSMPAERGLRPEWISGRGRSVTQYHIADVASTSYGTRPVVHGRDISVHRSMPSGAAGGVDLVRAAPPQRPRSVTSRRLIDRQRTESAQIAPRMQRERAELTRIQERERRERPNGVSAETLRQRQQAEQRAQDALEERMKRAYEHRQQELNRQSQDTEDRDRAPRGRGRGSNRRGGQGERS